MPEQMSISPVGKLLKHWRGVRRRSQLELALEANVSARHVSFIETGRSRPSRGLPSAAVRRSPVPPSGRRRWWLRRELLLLVCFARPVLSRRKVVWGVRHRRRRTRPRRLRQLRTRRTNRVLSLARPGNPPPEGGFRARLHRFSARPGGEATQSADSRGPPQTHQPAPERRRPDALKRSGGTDGTRTRDLRRDRPAF